MNKEFHQSLPKVQVAAGCLIRDPEGRVLLVEPTYKTNWEIPGGAVEVGESPLTACIREVAEEIGVGLHNDIALLSVDHHTGRDGRPDMLRFVFDGGVVGQDEADGLRVMDLAELRSLRFVHPERIGQLTKPTLAERIHASLNALTERRAVYLEHGETPIFVNRPSAANCQPG